MAGMFDEIVAFLARADLLDAQRKELGLGSGPQVRDGAILSAAAVIGALADWTTGPAGKAWVEHDLPSVDPSLDGVVDLSTNRDHQRFGRGLVGQLFGSGHDGFTAQLASRSGLDQHGASSVLATTAWIVAGHLARMRARHPSINGLVAGLDAEERDLRAAGWDSWLDTTLAARGTALPGVVAAGDASSGDPSSGGMGPLPSSVHPEPSGAGAPERRWSRWMVLGFLLVMVAGAAVVAFLVRTADDDLVDATPSTTTLDDSVGADDGEPSAPSTTAATAVEADTSEGETADEGSGPVATDVPDVVEYSLTLTDPAGAADAGGNVDLRLDTVSGEVCYEFDMTGIDAPYAAHIHVGPTATNGGITVDFGFLDSTDTGCLQAHPADLVAATSSPSARYVEAHDPGGAFSLRSQLRAGDPDATADTAEDDVNVDVDDGSAHLAIAGGTVVLRGAVADEAAREAFFESQQDLTAGSIEVVDELEIVAGSPPPSGRVVIDDAILFDFDSTDLSRRDTDVLAGIAAVLQARPSWSVSIVGHTDDSGAIVYNLPLSLERASVVRAALIDLGAPELAVTVQGLGPFGPVASNDTSSGRAENRRIDFAVDTGS